LFIDTDVINQKDFKKICEKTYSENFGEKIISLDKLEEKIEQEATAAAAAAKQNAALQRSINNLNKDSLEQLRTAKILEIVQVNPWRMLQVL